MTPERQPLKTWLDDMKKRVFFAGIIAQLHHTAWSQNDDPFQWTEGSLDVSIFFESLGNLLMIPLTYLPV